MRIPGMRSTSSISGSIGADPVWLGKRRAAYAAWTRQNPRELAIFGNVAGRYRDYSELLFNLRALQRFFPQHG